MFNVKIILPWLDIFSNLYAASLYCLSHRDVEDSDKIEKICIGIERVLGPE